jgi:hypothetical protein
MTHFDGHGNLSQVDFVTINGGPSGSEWRPGTGTYEVNPDCTGTAEIHFTDGQPTVNLRMVVVGGGRQVMNIVEGNATGATGIRSARNVRPTRDDRAPARWDPCPKRGSLVGRVRPGPRGPRSSDQNAGSRLGQPVRGAGRERLHARAAAVPAEDQDGDGDRTGGGRLPNSRMRSMPSALGIEVGEHDVRVER